MKLKTKLYAFKMLIFLLIASALLVSYLLYLKEYNKYIESAIDREINAQTQLLAAPIVTAQTQLKNKLPQFLSLHEEALKRHKANPQQNLYNLKSELIRQYKLSDTEVELFLINKEKIVYDTTFAKDLNLNLAIFPNGSRMIDKAFSQAGIHMSQNVSRDPVDLKYRLYSYARVDDDTLLEVGFTNATLKNKLLQSLFKSHEGFSTSLYSVLQDEQGYFYYPMLDKEMNMSKDDFYQSLPRYTTDNAGSDWVMQAFFSKGAVTQKSDNRQVVYVPILNIHDVKAEYHDIIAKFDIDLTEHNRFLDTIAGIFFATFVLAMLGLLALYWLVKKQFTNPINLITQQIQGAEKIPLDQLHNENNEFTDIATSYNALFDKLNVQIDQNAALLKVDHLTQIKNRKAYDDMINVLIADAPNGDTFSMLLFDIDDFKKINDNHGHDAGDKVLVEFSQQVADRLSKQDLFFRMGGEEFAIILPTGDTRAACQTGEHIRQHIADYFRASAGITLSMGAVTHKPNESKKSIYKRADDLMYQAKKQGKNQVCCQPVGCTFK